MKQLDAFNNFAMSTAAALRVSSGLGSLAGEDLQRILSVLSIHVI
jgi:hypothetical protein